MDYDKDLISEVTKKNSVNKITEDVGLSFDEKNSLETFSKNLKDSNLLMKLGASADITLAEEDALWKTFVRKKVLILSVITALILTWSSFMFTQSWVPGAFLKVVGFIMLSAILAVFGTLAIIQMFLSGNLNPLKLLKSWSDVSGDIYDPARQRFKELYSPNLVTRGEMYPDEVKRLETAFKEGMEDRNSWQEKVRLFFKKKDVKNKIFLGVNKKVWFVTLMSAFLLLIGEYFRENRIWDLGILSFWFFFIINVTVSAEELLIDLEKSTKDFLKKMKDLW